MLDRQRQVVLISGATSGLCAGVAERAAERGYRVIVVTRVGGGDATRTLARVRRFDTGAAAKQLDLLDRRHVDRALAEIEEEHGQIYAFIHGRGPMQFALFADSDESAAQELFSENVFNGVTLAGAVLPLMRKRRQGRLLFFGMTGSSVTRPARGLALYGAAKAATVAFARGLALEEAAHGITVNVIEPGDIREKERSRADAWQAPATNPSGHAGSWEDVADAACFLLSPEAGFVNGAVLAVGGGLINASE